MQLCIFEDQEYYKFEPLTFSRPVFDLKVGASTIREKLANILKFESYSVLCRDYLKDHLNYDSNILVNKFVEDDYIFINGRVAPDSNISEIFTKKFEGNILFKNGDVLLAFYLSKDFVKKFFLVENPVIKDEIFNGMESQKLELKYFTYAWDLIYNNKLFLSQDFNQKFLSQNNNFIHERIYLIKEEEIFIDHSAKIGYNVVLDASNGPIIIDENAQIMHNTVIYGPAYIGKNSLVKSNSQILGDTSIGNFCKVAGEITNSILLDYSNKQHEGFLGHSYLGSWVNLGAGTITSNLKNNYSKIEVELSFGKIKTDLQFLGLIAGDHTKSAIGTRFNTSTVVGFSCNIFGAGFTNKFIPSFSWGSIDEKNVYQINKAIEVAKIVYLRRGKEFSQLDVNLFERIFNDTKSIREKYGYK